MITVEYLFSVTITFHSLAFIDAMAVPKSEDIVEDAKITGEIGPANRVRTRQGGKEMSKGPLSIDTTVDTLSRHAGILALAKKRGGYLMIGQ